MRRSPTSADRAGAVVHCLGTGWLGPNSVGPLRSGSPTGVGKQVLPGGDWPILMVATLPSWATVMSAFQSGKSCAHAPFQYRTRIEGLEQVLTESLKSFFERLLVDVGVPSADVPA